MHYSHKILSHSILEDESFLARIKSAEHVANLLTHPPLFEHRDDGNLFTEFHQEIKKRAKPETPLPDEIQAKRDEIYLEGMRLIRKEQSNNLHRCMADKIDIALQDLLSSPWQCSPFINLEDRHLLFQHVIKTERTGIKTSKNPKIVFKNCLLLIKHLSFSEDHTIQKTAEELNLFCESASFKAVAPLPDDLIESGISILDKFIHIPLAEGQPFHVSNASLPDFPPSSPEQPRRGRQRSQSLLSRLCQPFRRTPTPDPLVSATFKVTETSLKDTVLQLLKSKDGRTQLASHLTHLTCTLCNEFHYDTWMAKLDGISLKAYPNAHTAFEIYVDGLGTLFKTIVQESNPKDKSNLINKIIQVAITCKDHHDIVTARILLSGLLGKDFPSKHNQLKDSLFSPSRNYAELKDLASGHLPYPIELSLGSGIALIENEKRSDTVKTAVSLTTFVGLLKVGDQFFDPDKPLKRLTDVALLKQVFPEIIQFASDAAAPPTAGSSLAFLPPLVFESTV